MSPDHTNAGQERTGQEKAEEEEREHNANEHWGAPAHVLHSRGIGAYDKETRSDVESSGNHYTWAMGQAVERREHWAASRRLRAGSRAWEGPGERSRCSVQVQVWRVQLKKLKPYGSVIFLQRLQGGNSPWTQFFPPGISRKICKG